jgi:hypothetical protein
MPRQPEVFGRYVLYDEIAVGGMASIHFGRMLGTAGFARTVAIKRLHPQFARDPDFSAMLLDEARLASRVRHPNVVPVLDVIAQNGELLLVMEYVAGESLARTLKADGAKPGSPEIHAAIMAGVLHGLHAAHEAKNVEGEPLGLVHRDVSPQNILVGLDGVSRIVDFGIAKAVGRAHTTRDGTLKGKLAYMAPEQIEGGAIDRRTDVFAAGIVLWEMLTGSRLFGGAGEGEIVKRVLDCNVPKPSSLAGEIPLGADEVVLRALSRDPTRRFATAEKMALAVESCFGLASAARVGAWVDSAVGESIRDRGELLARVEREPPPPSASESGSLVALAEPTGSAARPARRLLPALASAGIVAGVVAALLLSRVGRSGVVTEAPAAQGATPASPVVPSVAQATAPSADLDEGRSAPAVATAAPPVAPVAAAQVAPVRSPSRSKASPAAPHSSAPAAAPEPSSALSPSVPCTKRKWVPDDSGILHPVPDCP